jgi:hypothetical protein
MINQSQTKLSEIFGLVENAGGAKSTQTEDGQIADKYDSDTNSASDSEKADRHCNLIDVLAGGYDRTTLEEAIGRGFTRKFDCHFAVYELTDEEMEFGFYADVSLGAIYAYTPTFFKFIPSLPPLQGYGQFWVRIVDNP